MTKLPRNLDVKDLENILISLGYIKVHQKGSHIKYSKYFGTDKQSLTIPNHKPIKVGTLSSIIKQICDQNKIQKETFLELIQNL